MNGLTTTFIDGSLTEALSAPVKERQIGMQQ